MNLTNNRSCEAKAESPGLVTLKMMNSAVCILSFLTVAITVTESFKLNRCTLPSKSVLASSAVSSPVTTRVTDPILGNFDYRTDSKLPWVQSGYKSWNFQGHKVNYIDVGNDGDVKKPPLLLIHGFGASVYHWRYNIPVLARDYHVYAIDLLGFGLSDKPIVEYNAELWRDQALAFIKEVVGNKIIPNTISTFLGAIANLELQLSTEPSTDFTCTFYSCLNISMFADLMDRHINCCFPCECSIHNSIHHMSSVNPSAMPSLTTSHE